MTTLEIARIAHEVNLGYCWSIGDCTQPRWEDAPDWQKSSAHAGVVYLLQNPGSTPEQSHAKWLEIKKADGWKFGPVKDAAKKEHPCMVPYDSLPHQHCVKDYLFLSVVEALRYSVDPASLASSEAVQVEGPDPTATDGKGAPGEGS